MTKKISLLLLFSFICNSYVTPVAVDAQSVDPRFGAIESFWAPNEAAQLGVGWERILFYWSEIQPNGPTDWNTLHVLEEWLTEANAQGRTIVGLLKNTPAWATDDIPFAGVPRGLELPIDDPNNLWATYVRQIANYYGPRGVHHWIIWNEPDIAPGVYGHEFSGTIEEYYRLLKVAYLVMKEVDPTATIHLAGLTYWHDPGYFREFLRVATADPEAAANNYFFDVISLHIYFRVETVQSIVQAIWATQAEFGISKEVWVNETNAAPNQDPEWPVDRPQFEIDLEQQAWYIVQAHALGFAAGAARIGVYKLIDIQLPPGGESFGILRPNFSQRPAYFAYQNTIEQLNGFSYPVQKQQLANYFIISFPKANGMTRVMWARNPQAVSVQIPAQAAAATLVTAMGEVTELVPAGGFYEITLAGARCSGECLVGGPPLFLVEEGFTPGVAPTAVPPPPATATSAITATAPIASASPVVTATAVTATQTPLPTATATLLPPTATATATMLLSATATNSPPATATATMEPTTAVPTVAATEVALVVETAVPQPTAKAPAAAPTGGAAGQLSWLFLGAGALLFLGLAGRFMRRRD